MFGRRDLSVWFDEAKRGGNPYLTEWLAVASLADAASRHSSHLFRTDRAAWERSLTVAGILTEFEARRSLTAKYSFAVPCDAALALIASLGPVVEIGAGTGYWSWLLRQRGVDVRAYDLDPPPSANCYHKMNPAWTRIEQGGPGKATEHSDRTLFLCWPPYDDPMALDCLASYGGSTVVFVGEGDGGCTGDSDFFLTLDREWEEVATVGIPQFEGIHDYLTVYRRK